MLFADIELATLVIAMLGALLAGFTCGFAGFGTGLVAAGFWFHVLPPAMVPPLAVMGSMAAQLLSLTQLRKSFNWHALRPYLIGGLLGVPPGVLMLALASPELLRFCVGLLLVTYTVYQLFGGERHRVTHWGGHHADRAIGVGGGFLGGFAGIPGPLPIIWLRLRGGTSREQRTIYQPFNLLISTFASATMLFGGQIDNALWPIALCCLPATLLGAWVGGHIYTFVSEALFRKVVLMLLLLSGTTLVYQTLQI